MLLLYHQASPVVPHLDVRDKGVAPARNNKVNDIIQGEQVTDFFSGGHKADEVWALQYRGMCAEA